MNLNFKKKGFGLKTSNLNQINKDESEIVKCLELADEILEKNKTNDDDIELNDEKLLLKNQFDEALKKSLTINRSSSLNKIILKSSENSNSDEQWEKTLKIYTNTLKEERHSLILKNENLISEMKYNLRRHSDSPQNETPSHILKQSNLNTKLKIESKTYKDTKVDDLNKINLEQRFKSNELKMLKNQKSGIGRTLKQLKLLYENHDIDLKIFTELFEEYKAKIKSIEAKIEQLMNLKKK